jgi:hypothetical protein
VEIAQLTNLTSLDVRGNELSDSEIEFIKSILPRLVTIPTQAVTEQPTEYFFSLPKIHDLTIEQQMALNEEYPIEAILESWTGPDFNDKDFRFGSYCVEVKLTSSKVPKIKISSERQLDIENLTKLYLVLYVVEEVNDKGFSLNSLIEQIRMHLNNNHNALKFFNERLCLIGYFDEDFENYNKQYALRKRNCYEVNLNFPRLVSTDLPVGLYETKYSIELSAIEPFILSNETIIELIK